MRQFAIISALILALPATVFAGPARVDGLAGDPANGRNSLFVTDMTNVFLNPAQVNNYGNEIHVTFGVLTASPPDPGDDTNHFQLRPTGGGIVTLGSANVGVYLARPPTLYSIDQGPMAGLGLTMMAGGAGGAFNFTSGTSAPLFLPVDILVGGDFGSVQVGGGVYAAFGRSHTETEVRTGDEEFSIVSQTRASNYVSFGGGAVIPGDAVTPEFWLRGGLGTAWEDNFAAGATYPDDPPAVDNVSGVRNYGSIGGGFRATIAATDTLSVIPGFALGYASGQPYTNDRTADLAIEDDVLTLGTLGATAGVGVEFAPSDHFTAVGTLSLDMDYGTTSFDNSEEDTANLTTSGSFVNLRAPVASIGAEARPVGPLVIRGSVRAGMFSSYAGGGLDQSDSDGDFQRDRGTTLNGPGSLSASGGLGLAFDHVLIDATVGGALMELEDGDSFFSRLDVTFLLPSPGSAPIEPEPAY